MKHDQLSLKIGLVGPCAAGKTTLASVLKSQGFEVRHIAQEHSYVPYMWQRISNPDILIFLDVSYEQTLLRRRLNWTPDEYHEQQRRLQHARQHADLVVNTDPLTLNEVLQIIEKFIRAFRR